MEIQIDENQVQTVLNEQATSGVKNAFNSYSIRSAIEETISKCVIPQIVTAAIESAASEIDIVKLQTELAKEIARSVTKGVQAVIRETMAEIVMNIRKVPDYDHEERKKAKMEILATFDRQK